MNDSPKKRNHYTKKYSWDMKLFAKSNFTLRCTMGGTTAKHIFVYILLFYRGYFSMSQCIERFAGYHQHDKIKPLISDLKWYNG